MDSLKVSARVRRRQAYRPGTLKNYRSSHILYIQFCQVYGIVLANPSVDDISAFAEWLIVVRLAPSTIKNIPSAVRILYMWWQKPNIVKLFQSDAWSMTLRGISKSVRPSQLNKSTMSIQDLVIAIQSCSLSLDFLPIKVGILFGFLRVSNLAPPKVLDWDPTRHTTWDDVHASDKSILFKIKWSKTRQHSSDSAVIPLPALGDSPLCPLRAWWLYQAALASCDLQTPTPLLVSFSGESDIADIKKGC